MADTGSVLAGAGTGAAAGSAIAPGVGTAIGAGVGALGSLVSGWLSGKSANSNNASSQARNQAYWKEQFDLTNARQDWLNQNSASIQKQALRQAGLNPALAMQGASFSGNASSVSGVGSASPSGGDYSGIGTSAGSLIQNLIGLQNLDNDTQVAKSQAHLNESNAIAQDLANKVEADRQKAWSTTSRIRTISSSEADEFNSDGFLNPEGRPWVAGDQYVEILPSSYGSEVADFERAQMAVQKEGFNVKNLEYDLMRSRYRFEQLLADAKNELGEDLAPYILAMPYKEYDLLCAQIADYYAGADLKASTTAYNSILGIVGKAQSNYYHKMSGKIDVENKRQSMENEAYGAISPKIRGYADFLIEKAGEVVGISGHVLDAFYKVRHGGVTHSNSTVTSNSTVKSTSRSTSNNTSHSVVHTYPHSTSE